MEYEKVTCCCSFTYAVFNNEYERRLSRHGRGTKETTSKIRKTNTFSHFFVIEEFLFNFFLFYTLRCVFIRHSLLYIVACVCIVGFEMKHIMYTNFFFIFVLLITVITLFFLIYIFIKKDVCLQCNVCGQSFASHRNTFHLLSLML